MHFLHFFIIFFNFLIFKLEHELKLVEKLSKVAAKKRFELKLEFQA